MSGFWTRKMQTLFRFHDFDKDGTLTKNDFEEFANRFAKRHQIEAENNGRARSALLKLWSLYSNNNDGPLTEETFIDNLTTRKSEADFHQAIAEITAVSFDILDADGDGSIDFNELVQFFETYGFDKTAAGASFQALDEDNDGLVSLKELTENYLAFFTSEDEAHPSKYLWGPLV